MFVYRGAPEPALRTVSLDISARSLLAVRGPVGSGKTALAQLIAGLHRRELRHLISATHSAAAAITSTPSPRSKDCEAVQCRPRFSCQVRDRCDEQAGGAVEGVGLDAVGCFGRVW